MRLRFAPILLLTRAALAIAASLGIAASAQAQQHNERDHTPPETPVQSTQPHPTQQRTVNNGNVILEDIPEIPSEIIGALNRYQNVRAAVFRAWTTDGRGSNGLME